MRRQQWQLYGMISLSFGLLFSSMAFSEEYIRTDRYTLAKVEAESDQKVPLTTLVTLSFGADIKTIGDAITELLQGSGYQWVINSNGHDDQLLQVLALPAITRTLGPIRLDYALTTLAGSSWLLHVDELHRTVSFEVATTSQSMATP